MFQNEVLHPPNDLVCKEPLLLVYTSSGNINNIKKACPNVVCSAQDTATENVPSLMSIIKLPPTGSSSDDLVPSG